MRGWSQLVQRHGGRVFVVPAHAGVFPPRRAWERYGPALRRLHARMCAEGRFEVRAHRFLIVAERTGSDGRS
ncbi:hypothetical protein SAMN05444716_102529 [Streptomyces harbinensis]|uniref:Uncharacterized protein n=1 Tax=Streptomyces harbinensis TaxID=1176198 RepID=A0A1I6QZD4_9ACTN|nr:hypothetical protein SAMN05444716_102529 [Streptomyces harbinensis]